MPEPLPLRKAPTRVARASPARVATGASRKATRPVPTGGKRARCACGGGCPKCRASRSLGTAGDSAASDRHERDADHLAERVMAQAGPAPGAVFGSLQDLMDRSAELAGAAPVAGARLHADGAAAAAARSLGARAYAYGNDVYFGPNEFRPDTPTGQFMVAHELAHVAQQQRIGTHIQRFGGAPDATPPTDADGLGVPAPDCTTTVNEVFLLGAIYAGEGPACRFAQIHERLDPSRYRAYRADHPSSATPCALGDIRSHGSWLGGDRWRILDIGTDGATVMNACGNEEWLPVGDSAPAPAPLHKHGVEVPDSNFGPGSVELFDGGKRVVFKPKDGSAPREFRLEIRQIPRAEPMTVYVPQQGPKIPYSPSDLAGMLRVRLLGEGKGEPLPAPPEAEDDMIPGSPP